MKCPKCEFDNPEGMLFCVECGNKLESTCPECGFGNSPDFKFCGKCGHGLLSPIEAAPIDFSQPQSYTPKHLQDKILTTRSSIEGERKLVTVFFADVANYTAMSEKLGAEEVHQIMDGCFKILMDEIHKYEGTINQFTGDGVMALFGAPVAHEDHAQRACYAALAVQKSIEKYAEKIKKDTNADFQIRVGINSGPVIVGSIGDDLRMDYTAVGDTTNMASRMETASKPGSILLSENTHKIVERYFEFIPIGKQPFKGKEEAQEAYELIKASEITTRIEASAAKGLTRFVGRNNSMGALMETWEKVQSGSGQVVGIVGEAGVGKSRLVLEFRSRLSREACTFLEGQCLQYGSNMPYLPILDITKSYFDIIEDDREFIVKKKIKEKIDGLDEKLTDAISRFQELLSLSAEDERFTKLEAKQKRDKTFEAIRDLLLRLSENQALILVIEDLHWVDNTSQEFLDYFVGWIASKPVLLLLLYQPEYTHQWGSKSFYNRIGLDHLGPDSSTELVRAMLEGGEIAPELRALILERAAGNPLFMEEFTYSLRENGTIQLKGDQYVLSSNISELDVPDTVQGIIAARMDRLEDNLKRTMQVASVIGRDFAYRILQAITGMQEGLKSHLLNLQGLEFIFEKSLFPELEYIFKHALTRDVAYNSLLQKRRKEIHEQIGLAIEELYSDRLEELYEVLAYHYDRSDNHTKAIEYLKLCIQKSADNYSNWEAFQYGQQAISLLDKIQDSDENKKDLIECCLKLEGPMWNLGYPEGSLELILQGMEIADHLGDMHSLIHLESTLSEYYGQKGDPTKALEHSEEGFRKAIKLDDHLLLIISFNRLIYNYLRIGAVDRFFEFDIDIFKILEEGKDNSIISVDIFNVYHPIICCAYGTLFYLMGDYRKAEVYFKKAFQSVRLTDNPIANWLYESHYAGFLGAKGDFQKAIIHFEKSILHTEKSMNQHNLAWSLSWMAQVYLYLQDYDKALSLAERAILLFEELRVKLFSSIATWMLGSAHLGLGNLEKASFYLDKAIKEASKLNEMHWVGMASVDKGRLLYKKFPLDIYTAEQTILNGIQVLQNRKVYTLINQCYLFLGEFYISTNQKNKAVDYLTKAKTFFDEQGADYWLDRTQKAMDQL